MSAIGTGNLAAVSLATTFAAGQRSDTPQAANAVAQNGSDFARRAAAMGAGRDVEASHTTEDRDADGRMAWMRQGETGHDEADADQDESQPQGRARDPHGRRGGRLDLSV